MGRLRSPVGRLSLPLVTPLLNNSSNLLKCHICSETFRQRHHLTRHMTSHRWLKERKRIYFSKSIQGTRLTDHRLFRGSLSVRIDAGQFIGLFSVKNLFEVLNEGTDEEKKRKEEYRWTVFATIGDHVNDDRMSEQCRERDLRQTIHFHVIPNGEQTFLNMKIRLRDRIGSNRSTFDAKPSGFSDVTNRYVSPNFRSLWCKIFKEKTKRT